MTTITIERALLERVRNALESSSPIKLTQASITEHEFVIRILRAALAAPATAPEHLKARPDFIAGYNEGMADAKRMQMAAALECQRQLVNVQVRSARTTCAACGWESSFEPPIHYETCPSCGGRHDHHHN